MGPRLVFSAGEVPEIPASRLSLIANAREPLLFWVHTGHAELQIGDRTRSVTAGAANLGARGNRPTASESTRERSRFPFRCPRADLPPTLKPDHRFRDPGSLAGLARPPVRAQLGISARWGDCGGRTTRACRGGPFQRRRRFGVVRPTEFATLGRDPRDRSHASTDASRRHGAFPVRPATQDRRPHPAAPIHGGDGVAFRALAHLGPDRGQQSHT